MDQITYTAGDVDAAISIMREAAQWLIDTCKPLWRKDNICREKLSCPENEFIVLWEGDSSIAAMILNFHDPIMWPDIDRGTSGFIHKLSIRRRYAGKGYSEKLIKHVKNICKSMGIDYLRLDCELSRGSLCRLYENMGFRRAGVKKICTVSYGVIECALYEMKLS
jgi:GNAT superfamily N-acetyltransferase